MCTYRLTLESWIKFAGILCSISSCDDASIKDVRCLRWFCCWIVGERGIIVGVSDGGDALCRRCWCLRLCGEFWLLVLFDVRSRWRVVRMEVVVVGVTIVGAPSDECWDDAGLSDLLESGVSLFGFWSTLSLPSSEKL